MSYTHKVTYSYNDGGTVVSFEDTQTAGQENNISQAIGATASAKVVDFDLDISACKSLYIEADQNLTIVTNITSTTVGADTIRVGPTVNTTYGVFCWSAGVAVASTNSSYTAQNCGLSADITTLYVTNDSSTAATLVIKSLADPTA